MSILKICHDPIYIHKAHERTFYVFMRILVPKTLHTFYVPCSKQEKVLEIQSDQTIKSHFDWVCIFVWLLLFGPEKNEIDLSCICQKNLIQTKPQTWTEAEQPNECTDNISFFCRIYIPFPCNHALMSVELFFLSLYPSFCSKFQPLLPNSAAYFFATGGGYDKLEVYKCSDSVKTPAVTREMVIRFPSRMVSWRHEEFHMVIQMLLLNTHVHRRTHTHARMHIHINTQTHALPSSLQQIY